MSRQREISAGRRDRFAVKVSFLPDPDYGCAATNEYSISWGSFEIWVDGQNVCGHVAMGEPANSVHWYLLPFLQWLADNWDFLLHEERLPGENAGADSWVSMLRTLEPPPALNERAREKWEDDWQGWWRRHCLVSCREGGLFPNLFIRRWRDLIELSWGHRPLAGAPDDFRFNTQHGYARLDPEDISWVLYSVLEDAAGHLLDELPTSSAFRQLVSDVARLKSSDNRRRLGLLSGFRIDIESPATRWKELRALFPSDIPSQVSNSLFKPDESSLVVKGACPVALMFGSVSPIIDQQDAGLLAQKLIEYCKPASESRSLRNLVRDMPLQQSEEYPWNQGYRLAEELHENVGTNLSSDLPISVDEVYSRLHLTIDEVSLNDRAIRAVAIAGTEFRPAVLLNTNYAFPGTETRRFTLAHELCHILHDRGYGAQITMASGPWAPIDVERRANAFAAMFLMPKQVVSDIVRGLHVPLDNAEAIWEVARKLQMSFTATLEHLYNLNFINEVTRDALRGTLEIRGPN